MDIILNKNYGSIDRISEELEMLKKNVKVYNDDLLGTSISEMENMDISNLDNETQEMIFKQIEEIKALIDKFEYVQANVKVEPLKSDINYMIEEKGAYEEEQQRLAAEEEQTKLVKQEKITNAQSSNYITEEEALNLVKEELGYKLEIINIKFRILDDSEEEYLIQAFEDMETHITTIDWYYINKSTGELRTMFNFNN